MRESQVLFRQAQLVLDRRSKINSANRNCCMRLTVFVCLLLPVGTVKILFEIELYFGATMLSMRMVSWKCGALIIF